MKKQSLETYPYYNLLDPLLDALGWKGDEQELFNALPFRFGGFNTDEFISVMTSLGFILDFKNAHFDSVEIEKFPFVFFNQENTYLVIKKVGKKYLYFDSQEERYLERDINEISGTFIYFSTKNPLDITLKDQSKNWFPLLLKRFKVPFLVVTLTSLTLSLLYLIAPLFVMLIYSQISIANVSTNLWMLSVGILLYIGALVFFRMIRSYTLGSITSRLSFILNQEVFRRLLYLPPHISESGSVGRQLAKLKDFNTIVDFFSGPGFVAIFELPFVLILLVVMYLIGGTIALIPFFALILFVLLGFYYFPLVRKFSESNQRLGAQKNEFLLETFTKVNSIKNYALQDMWLNKFSEIHEKHIEASLVSGQLNTNINTISSTVISLAALGTIGVGVNNVVNGEMNSGALLASIMILWKVLNPLRTLFSLSVQLHRLRSSISQINSFMNLVQEENQKDSFVYYNSLKWKIEFHQVTVRYAQNAFPSLLGLNFKIEANDHLVIYGHGGSGKTSIIKLLTAMIQPQSGRVIIDDMNLKQINPIKLRCQTSFCPESGSFFDETIMDYFELANPEMKEVELKEMLSELGILHTIENLPKGFDTVLDETNEELFSFSLLKKINLAKTFLSEENILIIDSIELDLGPQDREVVIEMINRLKGRKTIIITTEEKSFFKIADKVLWLDRGKTKLFGPADKVVPLMEKELRGEGDKSGKIA